MNLWKTIATTNNIFNFYILCGSLQTLHGNRLVNFFLKDFSVTRLGNTSIKSLAKTSNISNGGFGKVCNKWSL